MRILFRILALLGIAALIAWYRDNLKKGEKKRIDYIERIAELFPKIQDLLLQLDGYTSYQNGYFNNYKLRCWQTETEPVLNAIKQIPYDKIKLDSVQIDAINRLFLKFDTCIEDRANFNKAFIEQELSRYQQFFNNIEGRVLDDQQRRAIVIDEDNNIVVAGAGSGKTTTIAGKVSYLIDRYKIKPSEILLISFTRKACEEMQNRIRKKMDIDIDVMTFHKLGLEIIASATNKKPSIFDDSNFKKLINDFLSDQIKDQAYLLKVTHFFTEYLKPYKEENEFQSQGEYIQYIKDNNIKSYKQVEVPIAGKMTLLREACKSMEEVSIANYLFLNNINYEYEKKYKHDTATQAYSQYKPDFYLSDYDIYIEHFGVDRSNNVPEWFKGPDYNTANQKYREGMEWKRSLHKEKKTALIETYSYEKQEGILLSGLEDKLKRAGVAIRPKSPEEVWEILNEVSGDDVTNFTQLIITFLNLLKSNNYSIADLQRKNSSIQSEREKQRNSAFIEILKPILTKYNSHLQNIGEIDFSDMINHATDYVNRKSAEKKYKYVIIDEFQDISIGRYKLIKSILDNNPGCKSFVVGDDWQSIYRFSGSDISIFTEFEKNFGVTSKSYIETTYRFNSSLINISSEFILKNPNQVKKKLKSQSKQDFTPYNIFYSESIFNNDTAPVVNALNEILSEKTTGQNIMLIGRYSHDIDFLKKDLANFNVKWDQGKESYEVIYKPAPALKMHFLTVHRAKGLEADYVILLNCSSGKYGFPSEQADDPILNLLLTQADQFPNGEERRLFYVAITRCRNKVHLIANSKYKSKFIAELEDKNALIKADKCPQCKTGILTQTSGVSAKGKVWAKLSCSNWNWGCDYLHWLT